jgi:hypothetical protein
MDINMDSETRGGYDWEQLDIGYEWMVIPALAFRCMFKTFYILFGLKYHHFALSNVTDGTAFPASLILGLLMLFARSTSPHCLCRCGCRHLSPPPLIVRV